MTPTPQIRLARVEDARPLAACHVACWREAYTGIVPAERLAELTTDLDVRTQRWLDILQSGPRPTWLATAATRVLGFACFGPARDDDMTHLLELYALYVRASEHGSGPADRLVQPAIGAAPAFPWVAAANPRAVSYYERIGFKADGGAKIDHSLGGLREVRMVRP